MSTKATEEQNDRYRHGICITCGNVPHSAGRPRCNDCHDTSVPKFEPKLKRETRRRRGW